MTYDEILVKVIYNLDLIDADNILPLLNSGEFDSLDPGFSKLQTLKQPEQWHPEGDAATHTALVFIAAREFVPTFGHSILWAALFHDIGKAYTSGVNKLGAPCFYGHEKVSEKIANKELSGRIPQHAVESITWCIRNHMLMHKLDKLRTYKAKALMDHKDFPMLVALTICDELGSKGLKENVLSKVEQTSKRIYT